VTRHWPRVCFAVLLLFWQLVAGSLTHAGPMTDPDCMHDHASHGQLEHGNAPPADLGDGCDSPVCQCPCGHTPALRVDLPPTGKVSPPAERPASAVDSLHADPIEEHFRPPT
jgi:hypothetical protein